MRRGPSAQLQAGATTRRLGHFDLRVAYGPVHRRTLRKVVPRHRHASLPPPLDARGRAALARGLAPARQVGARRACGTAAARGARGHRANAPAPSAAAAARRQSGRRGRRRREGLRVGGHSRQPDCRYGFRVAGHEHERLCEHVEQAVGVHEAVREVLLALLLAHGLDLERQTLLSFLDLGLASPQDLHRGLSLLLPNLSVAGRRLRRRRPRRTALLLRHLLLPPPEVCRYLAHVLPLQRWRRATKAWQPCHAQGRARLHSRPSASPRGRRCPLLIARVIVAAQGLWRRAGRSGGCRACAGARARTPLLAALPWHRSGASHAGAAADALRGLGQRRPRHARCLPGARSRPRRATLRDA
mmetsp:Transcript_84626/g.267102  ORF Transcript_84626/g.267102 Transcript_84626/m.267102 type:complete len:358 (+) Transcript_84626:196-1269(+)